MYLKSGPIIKRDRLWLERSYSRETTVVLRIGIISCSLVINSSEFDFLSVLYSRSHGCFIYRCTQCRAIEDSHRRRSKFNLIWANISSDINYLPLLFILSLNYINIALVCIHVLNNWHRVKNPIIKRCYHLMLAWYNVGPSLKKKMKYQGIIFFHICISLHIDPLLSLALVFLYTVCYSVWRIKLS